MSELVQNNNVKTYVKLDYEIKIYEKITILFLFAYYMLPQYFGIPLPVFDLSAQRIMILIMLLFIIEKKERSRAFINAVKGNELLPYIGIYMLITFCTGMLRMHIGTFMYPLIEFIVLFILIYMIKEVLGVKRTVKTLLLFIYLLCVLGIIEYIMMRSPFSYLETIRGLYQGGMIRSGSYRIMGPANHSLAYGLILITAVPIACIDFEKDQINIFKNILLMGLIVINIFLTGSRSTLAVFGVEIVLLVLFSAGEYKKKTLLFGISLVGVLVLIIMLFRGSRFSNYCMLQITTIIDEIFGTHYAVSYGADTTTLYNSSNYRSFLPKIFTLSWLNPIIGRGSGYRFSWYYEGSAIHSIDNFYIAQYIRYAYPGLIAFVIFLLKIFIKVFKSAKQNKSGIYWGIMIGILSYFINLWFMDTLQTIKYVYILIALFYCIKEEKNSVNVKAIHTN